MIWKLSKCSLPNDWEKCFDTKEEAVTELLKHICFDCLCGIGRYVGKNGKTDINWHDMPDLTNASDLLATACGCEYELEEDGEYEWECCEHTIGTECCGKPIKVKHESS